MTPNILLRDPMGPSETGENSLSTLAMAWRRLGGIAPTSNGVANVAREQHQRAASIASACRQSAVRHRADHAKNKTPGVLFGSAGSLRERWCEAGDSQVSLQGPTPNSISRNRVSARRFSGQP